MINALENWDVEVVKNNYQLRSELKECDSAWKGITIALACLKAETAKSAYDAVSVASWAWNVATKRDFGVNNLREVGVSIAEHARNLAGIVAAPFLSPEYAADVFLTPGPDKTELSPDAQKEVARLYAIAAIVDRVLQEIGIHYTACSGTVLGTLRNQSMIKGDDDIDLMFDCRLFPQMRVLFEEGIFSEMTGIEVFNQEKHTGGWQLYHPDAARPEGKSDVPAHFFVDLLPVKEENERYVFTHNDMRQRFLNDYLTVEEFADAHAMPFGPISLNMPKNAHKYVTRAYREQALSISYQFASHSVLAGVVANPNSPQHVLKAVKAIFQSRRRIARTQVTAYDHEVFQSTLKEIEARKAAFETNIIINKTLQQRADRLAPFKVFVDGVYDLFHEGHAKSFAKAIKKAEKIARGHFIELIVGVTGDKESALYKRVPVMTESERERAVESNPLVKRVISRSPTAGPAREFLLQEGINLVLHGDDFDGEKCKKYYGHAIDLGIFLTYPYEPGVSTTELLNHVKEQGKFPKEFTNLTMLTDEELIDRIKNRKEISGIS